MFGEMSKFPMEYWPGVVKFYSELVNEYGWAHHPMLDLVERLATSTLACELYPSTSHDRLGLALVETYQERWQRQMVFIEYRSDSKSFGIFYMRPNGGGHAKVDCTSSPDDPIMIKKILSWLHGSDVRRTENTQG